VISPQTIIDDLEQCVAALPPEEAQILQLYYVESCNWAEMCTILQISDQEARRRYWRAMDKLKPALEWNQAIRAVEAETASDFDCLFAFQFSG
jgi:DNA-directed RNA polymerase specialized sigma24 family protein